MTEPLESLRDVAWHTLEAEDVLRELETDPGAGLSTDEAESRLERYGENRIRSGEAPPWWRVLLHQVTDPLIYILLAAAVVSLLIQEYVDAAVILVVVVLNGAIGFYQEWRARKAIRSLAEMSAPRATVVRDGEERRLPSEEVVPGDIVVLAAGDRVPADARLIRVTDLRADESALTGESEPVSKQREPVDDERAVPGDQLSMAFSGTNVTRGRARGVVVRTGDVSELGHIARATQEVGEVETPIQAKMNRLGKAIGAGVVILGLVVVGAGLATGMELTEIVRTAVALAVGAVPEALPIVLTVTLAVGVQRMARRNAIIRTLPSVETLGATTVVGADKTGTLTANQMTTKVIWTGGRRFAVSGSGYDTEGAISLADRGERDGRDSRELDVGVRMTILAGLLANETREVPGGGKGKGKGTGKGEGGGDPTEIAMLVVAGKAGYDVAETRREYRQLDLIPFESERQFMATVNETPEGERCVFFKGAPEATLERCARRLGPEGEEQELDAEGAREAAAALADEGYRVLGMAFRRGARAEFDGEDPGSDLVFAGFQAMEDPIREEVPGAIEASRHAGIRVLMLTGDHARTARAIGEQLGLVDDEARAVEGREVDAFTDEELDAVVREVNVYARVSPDHKLKLVERLKAQGEIVAVTGDGVNDAPALQAAHLGVAMGKAGTDVAREASDMVLADDNFASITNAIEEGRIVFSNIRKVTYFLLSTGVGLVLAILSSFLGFWPLPFMAAQVLWINLVTNGLQDVALAFEKGDPDLLEEPPRDPGEGVLNRPVLWRLLVIGLLIATGTVGVFAWMLRQGASLELARSVAMTQMVLFQFFHVLNARSFHRSIARVPLTANRFLAISLPLALLAHLGALYLPFMQAIFETEPLSLEHWALVTVIGAVIIAVAELDKALLRRPAHERANDDEEDAARG